MNVPLALQALDTVRRECAGVQMVVVGDGPLRKQVEARHPAARFFGEQRGEALAAHYASADLLVFPSLSDTFGNVTLEALASGLPLTAPVMLSRIVLGPHYPSDVVVGALLGLFVALLGLWLALA